MENTRPVIEQTYSTYRDRALASLIGAIGDFDLAEDALQDAFITALTRWEQDGIPPNPVGWLILTARRKALDKIRRDQTFQRKRHTLEQWAWLEQQAQGDITIDHFPDERLKLIFTCCHPSLSEDAAVALTLRTLIGLPTEEIAFWFSVPSATVAQRIVRAKRTLKGLDMPFAVPPPESLDTRLNTVLAVIYRIFAAGNIVYTGDTLIRHDLCLEAIRLCTALVTLIQAVPTLHDEREPAGLLALLHLHYARRDARIAEDGTPLLLLEDERREKWHQENIKIARELAHSFCDAPDGYHQLRACIAIEYVRVPDIPSVNWARVKRLYAGLLTHTDSAIIQMEYANMLARAGDPQQALDILDSLRERREVREDFYYFMLIGEAHIRNSDPASAVPAYEKALRYNRNDAIRGTLHHRLAFIQRMNKHKGGNSS